MSAWGRSGANHIASRAYARYLRATVSRALAIAVKERKRSRTDEKAARMLASSLSMRCCSASFVLPAINLDVVGTGA